MGATFKDVAKTGGNFYGNRIESDERSYSISQETADKVRKSYGGAGLSSESAGEKFRQAVCTNHYICGRAGKRNRVCQSTDV